MFTNTEISNLLDTGDYRQLIFSIMRNKEYDMKDRKDIYKYLKRIQAFNSMDRIDESQFLCTLGDKDIISTFLAEDFSLLTTGEQEQIFSILFECYDYKQMQEILPDEIYFCKDFFNKILDGFADTPDYFRSFVISKLDIHKMRLNAHGEAILLAIVKRKYLLHYFVKLFEDAKKIQETDNWLKNFLHANIGVHTNFKEEDLVFISKYYNLKDIFRQDVLKYYFNSVYKWGKPSKQKLDLASSIVKTGFRGVTSVFTEAVKRNDIEMVKLLLPCKPRLDKAMACINSVQVGDLLNVASQERVKRKGKNSLDQPVDQ
jgi:hypothetical protein